MESPPDLPKEANDHHRIVLWVLGIIAVVVLIAGLSNSKPSTDSRNRATCDSMYNATIVPNMPRSEYMTTRDEYISTCLSLRWFEQAP
jgi:hypothetical protein